MTGTTAVHSRDTQPADLRQVLAADPPPFALLHRPQSAAGPHRVDILVGEATTVDRLADLPLHDGPPPGGVEPRHELLALVPYRQITERDFDCRDDGEPILALTVHRQGSVTVADALRCIPEVPIALNDMSFDVDDQAYAATVRAVLADEIGRGEGSNFVVQRSFVATIPHYFPRKALAIFRRLLEGESGAYWTFLVHTGARTFVGATPERHVSLERGEVMMNPISGTYRYPPTGPRLADVLRFLSDRKESDELYMVVDEELKMMARVCGAGGQVLGPYLKEMGRLAHTEYLIRGRSTRDVRDILRETMFAPTVTGSPIENACRVIARHEAGGRGYYSGYAALIGRDPDGQRALDASILIRTADIDRTGRVRIGVGATLVRLSDPDAEVAETAAKAAGVLAALGVDGRGRAPRDAGAAGGVPPAPAPTEPIGGHPDVRAALLARNATLARFWLEPEDARARIEPALAGLRVLVVDAEDTFTAMLAQQLRALGLVVSICAHRAISDPSRFDLVVVGPGPGDPRAHDDPKIAALRRFTRRLLDAGPPFLSVCLGHQVLSGLLGLELVRRRVPNQGVQREVDLFGRRERVGFYNTFAARCAQDRHFAGRLAGAVEVSRERRSGEVHALRGSRFASLQFHPESLLTENGSAIVSELITPLVGQPAADRRPVLL